MSLSKFPAYTRLFILPLTLIGLFAIEIVGTAAQDTGLFAGIGDSLVDSGYAVDDPAVIRTRYVKPDFKLLLEIDHLPDAGYLILNLFPDAIFLGIIDQVQLNRSGSTTWVGSLVDIPFSNFSLVARDGKMVGTVKMPGGFYRIGYLQNGVHIVQELDEGAYPPELEPLQAFSTQKEGGYAGPMADDGSLIDVLVVYTQEARLGVGDGSTTAIENLIDLAVSETNTGYDNSGIGQQLMLVHSAEVDYSEDDPLNWYETLERLTGTTDGYMDDVHQIRDNYCADEVVLLVDDAASCGLAWIGPGQDYAFALVSTNCATGYYSFGHELGHNMGALHDWYVDDNADTYAHGYVNAPERWRTIMAYNADCWDRGFNCTRLQFWSNPDVYYGGDPMGVPNGTSRSCLEGEHNPGCDADNHLQLNTTALAVSNFRDSGACVTSYDISGYVRDTQGTGISGVTVNFGGARPSVSTNEEGFYTQSGFANGEYTVSFQKDVHSFSPKENKVTILDGAAAQDATGYPFNPAIIPFNEDFESGSMGNEWAIQTDYEGRVEVSSSYPNQGNYSLLLDDSLNNSIYSHAAAILALDLSGQTQVDLSFWWQDFGDELDPGEDGVFISDDYGVSWYQAYTFDLQVENVYTHTILDLDSAASAAGMGFNDHYLVKFQFYDGSEIPLDGYAIDDVWVSAPVGPLVYQSHGVDDDKIDQSHGDGDGIAECGEVVELNVNLVNQGWATASVITATLSADDPYISFLDNTASSYADIPGGATASNNDDFEIGISAEIPNGYTIPFTLDITALNGGPWTDSFNLMVSCSKIYLPLLVK